MGERTWRSGQRREKRVGSTRSRNLNRCFRFRPHLRQWRVSTELPDDAGHSPIIIVAVNGLWPPHEPVLSHGGRRLKSASFHRISVMSSPGICPLWQSLQFLTIKLWPICRRSAVEVSMWAVVRLMVRNWVIHCKKISRFICEP